ncbi:FCS-Like Zinc finger 17 [Cannabis sativa]|uniref:FCS-Like Zinc finger 17 n=1 Tax=Cannabis sativa TaxID=3483 RepID=UPI0029CA9FF8|nr:FCS-Like Zinc finger 17 [Cannabis sativa]
MVLKFRIPFKLGQKENHKSNNTTHNYKKLSNAVGLRILVQISSSSSQQTSQESNYVIVKSSLRLSNQTPPPPPPKNLILDSCFLKTCHLCNKGLSLDKEVYMYRGDQGFCSIECRDRQIYLDDIKELEASTKKIVSSYRSNNSCTANYNYPSRHRDYQPQRHNKPISNYNYRRNRTIVIS